MSYTNQTQHYSLPQYVGTDVPAWLTDVNGAFATIDQGMNAAKTQADSAATAAGQAANDIVSINSTLGTQAGQISAAANAAAAAQTTANTADGKSDTNAQNINGLDARVTALEEGSGGGVKIKRYEIAAGSSSGTVPYDAGDSADTVLPLMILIRNTSDTGWFAGEGSKTELIDTGVNGISYTTDASYTSRKKLLLLIDTASI